MNLRGSKHVHAEDAQIWTKALIWKVSIFFGLRYLIVSHCTVQKT